VAYGNGRKLERSTVASPTKIAQRLVADAERSAAKPDGLYRVVFGSICAGFIIRGRKLAECAPVLRKSAKLRDLGVWISK
jgi:hypothetical protein